jgi:hypothetical protein
VTAPTADAAAPAAPALEDRLWRSPGLVPLFTASTTARLANEAARVAIVLLILDRTSSPALAGTVVGRARPARPWSPARCSAPGSTARPPPLGLRGQPVLLLVVLLGPARGGRHARRAAWSSAWRCSPASPPRC